MDYPMGTKNRRSIRLEYLSEDWLAKKRKPRYRWNDNENMDTNYDLNDSE